MEGKKKIETPPGAQAGPSGLREPNLGTTWFQFILFLHLMNTTKVSIFSANIFVNTTKNKKKIINGNPGHKKKEWFTMKSNICDIMDKTVSSFT